MVLTEKENHQRWPTTKLRDKKIIEHYIEHVGLCDEKNNKNFTW